MLKKFRQKRLGFSLLELLVVLVILGLLSTMVMVSYQRAQRQSRDAKRISDIELMKTGLLMYYADQKVYPTTGGVLGSDCPALGVNLDAVKNLLVPNYLAEWPKDSLKPNPTTSTDRNYCYAYRSNGADYAFLLHGVTPGASESRNSSEVNWDAKVSLIDPARDAQADDIGAPADCNNADQDERYIRAWKIYSAGGKCW